MSKPLSRKRLLEISAQYLFAMTVWETMLMTDGQRSIPSLIEDLKNEVSEIDTARQRHPKLKIPSFGKPATKTELITMLKRFRKMRRFIDRT
jgi:hypothetical protein